MRLALHLALLKVDGKSSPAMADIATLTTRYNISIPSGVRIARGWKPGQKFAFLPKGTGVLLVPVPEASELAGSAKGAKPKNHRDRTDRV
jgi:AbrB family looped-hinge helix DNA binding protein